MRESRFGATGACVKRRTGILLGTASLLLLTGIVLSYHGALTARVTVSWSYDYTPQPACSVVRAKDCIHHFEIIDYTNPQKPKLLRTVANPKNAEGEVDNISDSFSYGPPFGLRTIVVVAVARDKNGAMITSNPDAARKDVEIKPKVGRARKLPGSEIGRGEPRPHFRWPLQGISTSLHKSGS